MQQVLTNMITSPIVNLLRRASVVQGLGGTTMLIVTSVCCVQPGDGAVRIQQSLASSADQGSTLKTMAGRARTVA